ncbi:hypothetical protein KKG05_02675, partial [bacterium]|nr:hypothetical protein [bacterium]
MKSPTIIDLIGLAKGTTKTASSGLRSNRAGFLTELLKSITPSSMGEKIVSKTSGKGTSSSIQNKSQQSNDNTQELKTATGKSIAASGSSQKTVLDSPPKTLRTEIATKNLQNGVLQSLGLDPQTPLAVEQALPSSKASSAKSETPSTTQASTIDKGKPEIKEITSLAEKYVPAQVRSKAAVQPVRTEVKQTKSVQADNSAKTKKLDNATSVNKQTNP